VVSPNRWADITSQVDENSRPLVLPSANALNPLGVIDSTAAEGVVGNIAGTPVVVDAQIADSTVLVGRFSDAMLWETGPICTAFFQPLAAQLSVLLRCYGYVAGLLLRYPNSFVQITGFESPTYGS
jgi:hypothetical protein